MEDGTYTASGSNFYPTATGALGSYQTGYCVQGTTAAFATPRRICSGHAAPIAPVPA